MSNFLGEVGGGGHRATAIVSAAELAAREGVNLQKGMNFRDRGGQLSVFLVLSHEGRFMDEWDEDSETYVYQGHDSTTTEGGKLRDQIAMYPDGRITENGKFFRAGNDFKDGSRREPLQVQVYEKLDPGVWYDKGIFNIVDAKHEAISDRKVFKFYLQLADAEFYTPHDPDKMERMLSASEKGALWERCGGRCVECATQHGLRMIEVHGKGLELRCGKHGANRGSGLLG